jgi:hypothetical protein
LGGLEIWETVDIRRLVLLRWRFVRHFLNFVRHFLRRLLEFLDARAQAFSQFGNLLGAEENQNKHHNQNNLPPTNYAC